MNREEVEKIGLERVGSTFDLPTNKPNKFRVTNLPKHLKAEISFGQTARYRYSLTREGDSPYEQKQPSPTEGAALQALKNLLNWDPV